MQCTDPEITKQFEAYVGGGTIIVDLTDGTRVVVDYITSDDFMHGYLDENSAEYAACAGLETKFKKHREECFFCRNELNKMLGISQ